MNTRSHADSLRIGGFTPLTTTDYPGELAAVVFCQGCPWRCRYCHNGHLLTPARHTALLHWEHICTFLHTRRGLLDGVVFSGGEPTAQHTLLTALQDVRALGFKTGLHTSGAYPHRLRQLLPLLDWVGLDIKALPQDYPLITGVTHSGERAWHSLELLLDADITIEVRTTPMPGLDDAVYLERLMHQLVAAGVQRYVLQQCQVTHCYDSQLRAHPPTPLAAQLPPHIPCAQFTLRTG